MAIKYNKVVIQSYADALYSQALGIEVIYTILGFLLGTAGGVGLTLGAASVVGMAPDAGATIIFGVLGGPIPALIGFFLARPRAFLLRLQAQQALCFVQIEQNTDLVWRGLNALLQRSFGRQP